MAIIGKFHSHLHLIIERRSLTSFSMDARTERSKAGTECFKVLEIREDLN